MNRVGLSISSAHSLSVDMIPNYLKRPSTTRLKPCQERMLETCDVVPTDQCCGVIPCKLCLEFEVYGDSTSYGSADFATSSWAGTVGGGSFVAYWERNSYDECEFVVTFDGEEVYRATCYEGASCRNPAGSASASIGYDDGTLRWSVYEPRELALIDDPYTGCRDFFCGDCRCSCRSLCIEVSEVLYTDFIDTYSGTITDTAYSDCNPPVWVGTVGNFSIRLALGRDEDGNCIVTPTVNGDELEAVSVVGCADMSGTVELYDGSSFTFRCKQCECGTVIGDCICGRPLGASVTLLWSSANGTHGNAPREFELAYGNVSEPQITCSPFPPGEFPAYVGSNSGTYPIPMGGTRQDTLHVMMVCCIGCPTCVYYRYQSNMDIGDLTWYLTYILTQDCNCPAILEVDNFQTAIDYQISDITIFEDASNC